MTKSKLNPVTYTGTAVLNIFLLAAIIFLMMYFVIVSNVIIASSYKLDILNEELSGLMENNALLTAQKLSTEDSSVMLEFAQSHYMIQAGQVTHIFDNSDVALQR